jgi:glycosyltransferase involved in cell wall biosynthesis
MKIGIINLTRGGMSGGYRKYLRNVIPRLGANPAVEALLCASPKTLNVQDWFIGLNNAKFVDCNPFRVLHHSVDPRLREHLQCFCPDVLFVPVERYIRFGNVPTVIMIQNIWPLVYTSKSYPPIEKLRFWTRAMEATIAIKRAERIIAPSDFVRNLVMKKWKIPEDRIGLVYHGCYLGDKDTKLKKPHIIPANWTGNFLFTAGSIEPYRGLEDLLRAIGYLESRVGVQGLVIAGEVRPAMKPYWRKLENWIKKSGISSKICYTGHLDQDEMQWCYHNSLIFVMTSRVESFGMIAVEAMSHGCICISTNDSCLPEIFADTAIYYTPKNEKALAKAIQTVSNLSVEQRKIISERARKRASKFSWNVTAERTVAELAKAARG